jgi:nucleosome binding factor SPN SPT16 subunit
MPSSRSTVLKGGELRANPSSTHHSHELRRQRDATKELHQKESAAWEEEQKQLIEKIEAQELDIVALHSLLRRVR